jgi:predicted translin family RNA/ssDNA-binding protein
MKAHTDGSEVNNNMAWVSSPSSSSTSVHDLFQGFREELDEFNDRRERLIKASRDITNLSKKAIFDLQRSLLPDGTRNQAAVKDAHTKLKQVQDKYREMSEEITGDRFWRHQRQVSPGLQEYIEALSFAHYLDHGKLITFTDVQKTLADENGTLVRRFRMYDKSSGHSSFKFSL